MRAPGPRGAAWAVAALVVGLPHAAFSVFWALGGTWLLDTVGGSIEDRARAGDAVLIGIVWVAAWLKIVAALLPLAAVRFNTGTPGAQLVRSAAWAQAVVLTGYGGLLTVAGLLIQAGVIGADADADRRALAWHAYFWDPWFALWGFLVVMALVRSRRPRQRRIRRH